MAKPNSQVFSCFFQGLLLTSYLGLVGVSLGVAEFSTSQQQQSPFQIWYDMMRFNREGGGALPFSENTRLLFDTANVGTHNGAMGGERWAEGDLVMIVIHRNHPQTWSEFRFRNYCDADIM